MHNPTSTDGRTESSAAFPQRQTAPGRTMAFATGLIGGAVLIAAAVIAINPANTLHDPTLAHLLRGMALIKASMVLGAVALLVWRFRWPVSTARATAYVVATWGLAAATAMIWQLDFIIGAAVVFHLSALAIMLLAWRDDMPRARLAARAPARFEASVPAQQRAPQRPRSLTEAAV